MYLFFSKSELNINKLKIKIDIIEKNLNNFFLNKTIIEKKYIIKIIKNAVRSPEINIVCKINVKIKKLYIFFVKLRFL